MADDPVEVLEDEERTPALDPETRARRDAALRMVRKYGDPVLRSRALAVDRFDERLVDEARRMGQVMHDALGIGLAATQVGVMHRVLVYRVEADAPVAALVNPQLEWSSEETEIAEEGCLSLPGVLVEVERPVHVRVRGHDERGDALTIEASGLAARVIQHEMDHLDGVLILDRTPRDQRKQAMKVLRERLADSPHRPALVVTRPDRPRGRGRRLLPPPVAEAARSLGLDLLQPEALHAPETLAAIAAARPDALVVCAYGALVKEPLLSDYEILNVHPSLLPRWRGAAPIERAIMAGDIDTGMSIIRLTAGLDAGPIALQEPEPIRPDDDFGSLAGRLEDLGARLLVRVMDERPPFAEQPEDGVTYAEKITAGDRTLDPARPAVELERVVRALRPHIGARAELPGGDEFVGVWAATVVADGAAPGAGLRRDGERLLLDTADAALELTEVQPPGGRRMPAAEWLRGRRSLG